jgi:hypothetical protein
LFPSAAIEIWKLYSNADKRGLDPDLIRVIRGSVLWILVFALTRQSATLCLLPLQTST